MESQELPKLKLSLLILRAQSGSSAGFQTLFTQFRGLTAQYLRSLLAESDIDDVQQLIWLKVYQRLSSLSTPYAFKRWLMQIAHTTASDFLKKHLRHESQSAPEFEQIPADVNVDTELEDSHELHKAMSQLSFEHKEVIVLHYWQEFSIAEIAHILGCAPGTVKSRLFHARQLLHQSKAIQLHNQENI